MDKNALFVRRSVGDFAMCGNAKGGPLIWEGHKLRKIKRRKLLYNVIRLMLDPGI
jgi:hypothetical protein